MTRCTVVVPVHGRPGVTTRCLDALLETTADVEIILVDDGSPTGTEQALRPYGDRITIVRHREPAGFASACNAGAAMAAGEAIVFLNSDTIPQPGWLDALFREAAEHPRAAAMGSRLLYPDGTVQHAGVVVCADRMPRHAYRGFPATHPAVCRSRRLQVVTAACLFVRRRLFEGAGGFDPAFCNGYEDVDLCLRLGELGHEVRYCAASVLVHLESVSLSGIPRRQRANEIAHNERLYRERWASRVEPDDLRTYAADGLISLHYRGDGRPAVTVSPLLAELDEAARERDLERLLRSRDRQVAELLGDLIDLTVAVAEAEIPPAQPVTPNGAAPARASRFSELAVLDDELAGRIHELQVALAERRRGRGALPPRRLAYAALRRQLHASVSRSIPTGAVVLVASKGDDELLVFEGLDARHFPQAEGGGYAGHHPLTGERAISELEEHRRGGAHYFVLPGTMRWWLHHYDDFGRHLQLYPRVVAEEACDVYALAPR